jgi:hypothetical protein
MKLDKLYLQNHDFRFEPGKSGQAVGKRPQKNVSSESPKSVRFLRLQKA